MAKSELKLMQKNKKRPVLLLCCAVILASLAQCTSDNDGRERYRAYVAPPQYPTNYPYRTYNPPRSRAYYNPYDFPPPYGRVPYTDYDQYYVAPNTGSYYEENSVEDAARDRDLR